MEIDYEKEEKFNNINYNYYYYNIITITILILGGIFFLKRTANNKNIDKKEIAENNSKIQDNNQEKTKEENLTIEETTKNENTTITNNKNTDTKKDNNSNTPNKENNISTADNNISSSAENNNKNVSSEFKLYTLGNLQYYLYTPSNPQPNMPLIMYLHGGTNKKNNVESLLTTDGFPKYLYDGYYGDIRTYVVIPKLSNNYTGWSDITIDLRNLIKNINQMYGIDMNKVSLTGHSMGGTGTYQVQIKLPNTFACIAPMSGSVKNTEENINALSKTKIWAFVGMDDTIVNLEITQTIIKSLKEKGANASLTEIAGATHFDVAAAGYKNSGVVSWLVNCSK